MEVYKKTSKAWKWWIAQQCPSAYTWVPKTKRKWVPKVRNESVTKTVSFAIDNVSRITNVLKLTNTLGSNLSCIPSSSNSLADCTTHPIHSNDQFAPILGYGDLVQGNITINRVYYVEGLNHNLFSVGQLCDADLEVAFRKSTYKASPTQAWLWHRRLSHLNFDNINLLSKKDVVIGLPKLKKVNMTFVHEMRKLLLPSTDHILWDIYQWRPCQTVPASLVSTTKHSLARQRDKRKKQLRKALNILLSAISDRQLLSCHDATQMQNTFMDSHNKQDFGVDYNDSRGQPGLDELELDDLYNNLKPAAKLQIDEDAMEEIDIRWQVAMITARIRKFMRKTGRPIDLKPKNGITFDKSKIECFNCQKLGHFARECRFAKYQENRANGRNEKRIVAIEDSNSKALVATDNNEDIDWTKEFDAEPVTFAMMALTEVEQDDWSMEFDAEHVHFGQDGLGDFDWSNKADDTPVSLALMATNSEVPYCSKCSKSYKKLLESYQTERDNFQKARTEILGYQMSLESLEVILKTHEKNEYAWGDKYEQMEYDLKIRDLKLEEKQKELDQALKERDDFKVKLEKWSNASVLQNEVLNKQRYLSDKTCIGFGVESSSGMESDNSSGNTNSTESLYPNFQKTKGFHSVPPPTGTIIPPRANVSFTGIDELAIRNKVLNQENTKSSQPEIDRNKVIIEDWVDSDDEETDFSEIQKKTVFNSENSETSFENRSPSSQNSVGQESRKTGFGHKGGKLCFVCYSPNHLIKDCNLHERTFKQTQTHKPKGTQGSRDTRPVWNNINRVNHSNFSRNSRYPHQRRSFIPSAVLTREGLKSTARPKLTRTVPSKSTANVFYQGTARPKVPHAVLSQSTGRPYHPRMDNIRPRTSSFSPSSRSSTTRTSHRPQRPKKIIKSIWVKKGNTVGSQAVLPQNVRVKGAAMINPKQTWRPKGNYLDSVNRDNGSYTLKQFEYGNPEEDLKDYAIIDSGCSGSMTGDKDKLSDFKEFKGGYVAFGNDSKGGRISGKGTIKTSCLDFEKVSYVEELKFNLLSVSQICDKKHNATEDEAVLWHRRWGNVHLQKYNKCKQPGHLARRLKKELSEEPLELLHMDLFGPVSVESVNRKKYCLVVTDDCKEGLSVGDTLLSAKVLEFNRVTRKVQDCFHGKNNFAESKEQGNLCDDVEDLDVSNSCSYCSAYASKNVLLQKKFHVIAFEEEKKRIALDKGKECVDSTFTLKGQEGDWNYSGFLETREMNGVLLSRTKARLVAQGYRQEEGVDYDEVFAPVARIEAIRLFLAFASFMGFIVYQMDVKSAFLYGNITEEVYVKNSLQVLKILLIQTRSTELSRHFMACIKPQEHDKYVKDILNKFDFRTIKPASTPIEAHKSLGKDEEGEDVDVHLYRFQVSHKDSPFHLEAFSDSDYAGDNHDRRSTSGGCQYLGRRLVSWQCKKQTIVAISSTEAEYVAAASCCAQENESTICIVKNPVFHSKTKHIQIRHHFIQDCYEQRLINVVKIHTDDNVADLLTKGFDLARFNFLVVTIGMMNP
ncbi:putative ribonuclease H-like domain-containing protein [Tanacetum coccineum]